MIKKILIGLVLAALVAIGFGAIRGQAFGTSPEDCVPSDAWTETIEHPAITHEETVVVTPSIPAVEEVWANFSPNHSKEPFVGPPSFPSDSRGTWHMHNKIPGGHEGPDGVYFKGNPHKGGDWFYRHAGSPAVPAVTKTVTVVDEEAWTETIEHPAVVCPPGDPTDPPTPTDDPTPTDEPTPTDDPTPTDEPTPTDPPVTDPPVTETPTPEPTPSFPPIDQCLHAPWACDPPVDKTPHHPKHHNPPKQLTQCIDGAWVITQGDEVLSISGTCDADSVPVPTEAEEEGF